MKNVLVVLPTGFAIIKSSRSKRMREELLVIVVSTLNAFMGDQVHILQQYLNVWALLQSLDEVEGEKTYSQKSTSV